MRVKNQGQLCGVPVSVGLWCVGLVHTGCAVRCVSTRDVFKAVIQRRMGFRDASRVKLAAAHSTWIDGCTDRRL